jgi:hypothetical protein
LLLDTGNDSVTDTNFCGRTWTSTSDIEKLFAGISGPQNNSKDLTDTVDIFEQLSDGDVVEEILNETNHSTQHFKNSRGIVSRSVRG